MKTVVHRECAAVFCMLWGNRSESGRTFYKVHAAKITAMQEQPAWAAATGVFDAVCRYFVLWLSNKL